jgi:galactosylgalactosylxylosylprotein 3-beta-glucuronosyltransferase 1
VLGWFWAYNRNRKFPLDMAGFSVNLKLLIERKDTYFTNFTKSYFEGAFVENLVTLNEMEAKADSCTKVFF